MATLKDVAKRAGVSIATVSYCINQTKSVKKSTRDKIMQAVQELNYIPNYSAQNLKHTVSKEIGVIFPDIDEFYHSEILKGIISRTEATDYTLNIAFSYHTPKLEQKIIDQFIGKKAAGLILITCQPDNTAYFQNSLIHNNIPAVFIERFPKNIDANFLAFDNYTTCYHLCKTLIENQYQKIVLMTGSEQYFSEYECIRGFSDAHDDAGLSYSASQLIQTGISKEAGFKKTMFYLAAEPPQAIIASSQSLAKGIMEAFNLYNIKIPKETCIITLGEECWNDTNYLPNLIHTARTPYTLGKSSVDILLKNIKSPQFFEKEFMLFKDNVLDTPLELPKVPKQVPPAAAPERTLRILATSHPTMLALSAVSGEFEKLRHIKLAFDFVSYRQLMDTIVAHAKNQEYAYDIYLFDVSWLSFLAHMDALADITRLISENEIFSRNLIPKNLESCCYKGRYYGFPIIGGDHILFYRKDLFDSPTVQNQFQALHNLPLRPPKTWTEFNGIAKFFTKKYNPYSPTRFGTSVTGSINEEFALEILIRLWSYGGGLYDQNGRLALNTPQNVKGFQSLLETCNYTGVSFMEDSIDQSFQDFGNGKTAMLISFTEYASHINDCIHGDIITNVGYGGLPGRTPATVGWQMGLSRQTKHSALIAEYFKWICQKKTSYYMAALNGQSTVRFPRENHELQKLYPWLALQEENIGKAHSRIYPALGKSRLIAPYEIEMVLYEIFQMIKQSGTDITKALQYGQKRIEQLFS